MKKLNLLIIALFFLSLALSSCSSGNNNNNEKPGGPTTITFATFLEEGSQADAYKDIISKFEEKNSDIKVVLDSGANGYNDKIKNSLSSGKGPDIIGLQRSKMIEYVNQGSLKDLTEWVKSSGLKENYYGVNTGYGKLNGKYYGVGDLPYTLEWFYNTDLFKKAGIAEPQNLDELINICSKLDKYTQSPITLGLKDTWVGSTFFGVVTSQTVNSGELSAAFSSNSKEKFTGLKGANDAVNIVSRLVKSRAIDSSVVKLGYTDSVDAFVKGKSAILPMGSWAVEKIEKMKPTRGFNYSVFSNPLKLAASPNSLYSATAVQVITVNEKTAHLNEVMKFMDYLFSEEAQKIFMEHNGISGRKSANSETKDAVSMQVLKHLSLTDENSIMYVDNISDKMGTVTGERLSEMVEGDLKPANTWGLIVDETFAK